VIEGTLIKLRALEPEDLDLLYAWENNMDTWAVSQTKIPFSKAVLKEYLSQAQQDIYAAKQLRLMITDKNDVVLGCIDLFNFDPANGKAGVGILIAEEGNRNKGYGSAALTLLLDYGFSTLHLNQLYCNVIASNTRSIQLFKKQGFQEIGLKKQWLKVEDVWEDVLMLQRIRD